MSSGSTKELSKAIVGAVAKPKLPLPDDLIQIILAYIDKHAEHDDAYFNKLQEKILSIYQTNVLGKPGRFAPFLAILRELNPLVVGYGRLLQWWEKLSGPLLMQLVEEKGLAPEVRGIIVEWLVYEDDDEYSELDPSVISAAVAENILALWLEKSHAGGVDFDMDARFLESQLQLILIAFGRKRPQDLLRAIDKFFVGKKTRIGALTLLCEFVRHQPPHLHQVLGTDLFNNLLRCLQNDTSTRVISLAMTALIMFLPHIPNDLPPHLPALFNIFTRMLFWERERHHGGSSEDGNETSEVPYMASEDRKKQWAKLTYLLESEDDTVPELLHYFTFLYGLYPVNFLAYIRKPQEYLRGFNVPAAGDIDIEPDELHQRSERFRQVHLLHPNMFTITMEAELADSNRWMRSEAADVVAECMALYNPLDGSDQPTAARARTSASSTNALPRVDINSDIPEQALAEQGQQADEEENTPGISRHPSWRHTGSTAVASPDDERVPSLHRNQSQTSQSRALNADTLDHRRDSPTIPPSIVPSPSYTRLEDISNSQKSTRGNIFHLKNDSVHSLTSNHHQESSTHVDAYLQSLQREPPPRSPSLKPSLLGIDASKKISYLQREIVLLKNDLNFERYLKQQHLSHIGKLGHKQIREARVEAETQNLINSNRALKNKLDEAKRENLQLRKENEKSRANSRKWEAGLSAKLKALREESKQWNIEGDQLCRELATAKDEYEKLQELVVAAERKEITANQKLQTIEASLNDLEALRTENEKLTTSLGEYEAGEERARQAHENEEAAQKTISLLTMKLATLELELKQSKTAFEEALSSAKSRVSTTQETDTKKKAQQDGTKNMLDGALASSRNPIFEIQKAHNHLLSRYSALQSSYMDLKEKLKEKESKHEERDEDDEPLLSGTRSPTFNDGGTGSFRERYKSSAGSSLRKADTFEGVYNATSPLGAPETADFSIKAASMASKRVEGSSSLVSERDGGGSGGKLGMHHFRKSGIWKGKGFEEEVNGEGGGGRGEGGGRANSQQSPSKKDRDASSSLKKDRKKDKDGEKDRKDKKHAFGF